MTIYPIILCGGEGSRLWPVSRRDFPKQFARLIGQHSCFQQAVLRLGGTEGAGIPVIVAGDGNDVLIGGNSRDVLIGGGGQDQLSGGGGNDLLDFRVR